jgi:hypothetical protein
VAVAGQLGEALSGLVGRHRSIVDLTAARPLKNGRIDEGGFGMRVTRRVAASAVFDEHALDALAGNVRTPVLLDGGLLGVLRLRRIGEDASERQCGDKQRTEHAFHGVVLSVGGCEIRHLPVSVGANRLKRSGRAAFRPTARANAEVSGIGTSAKRGCGQKSTPSSVHLTPPNELSPFSATLVVRPNSSGRGDFACGLYVENNLPFRW